MKTVLCYGDSNTFGAATVPRPDRRYAPDERWPGVLRATLGNGWVVVEEGLGGRTTVTDDPVEGLDKNGRTYLLPCLRSHRPLDVVAIMLGTNDLKARFGKSAWEVAQGVGVLVDIVKSAMIGKGDGAPEVLLICPPPFASKLPMPNHAELFAGAIPKSKQMAPYFRQIAEEKHVHFLDAGKIIKSSRVDGFHLDPDAHAALGKAVAAAIGKMKLPG
jgi:lysophospholipase L1-like esterase